MTEKRQGTSLHTHDKMLSRYDDGLTHKHNKNHLIFRRHSKSHPVQPINGSSGDNTQELSSGMLGEFKFRKLRKRMDKGHIH